jgi:hypothetical protein
MIESRTWSYLSLSGEPTYVSFHSRSDASANQTRTRQEERKGAFGEVLETLKGDVKGVLIDELCRVAQHVDALDLRALAEWNRGARGNGGTERLTLTILMVVFAGGMQRRGGCGWREHVNKHAQAKRRGGTSSGRDV